MASHYIKLSDDGPYAPPTAEAYELHEGALLVPKEPDDLRRTDMPDRLSRTPSPTPSEAEQIAIINGTTGKSWWQRYRDRLGLHREHIVRWIVILILITLTILVSVFETKIITALQPFTHKMRAMTAGWLIPIAVMIVLSFPPLLGQEIIIILTGITWGFGPGFAIAAAGTILGELGTYYVFRFWCMGWTRKQEAKSIDFRCLTKVVQDGGVWIPILVRYSAIPDHYSTALFATCGMKLWVFLVSVFAALPNQLSLVYFGVAIEATISGNVKEAKTENIVNDVVIAVSVVATIAAQFVLRKMSDKVKPEVIYQRRKARQAKLLASAYESNPSAARPYDPYPSSLSVAESTV